MNRNTSLIGIAASAVLALVSASQAQAPAGAPAGSTGLCKDGSYWTGATKSGACRGHKGVQNWYATSGGAAAPAAAGAAPAANPSKAAAPAAAATTAATAAPAAAASVSKSAPAAAPAAGGGPGLVWVNSSSKTYHCSTDKWYGKTKSGEYMSEADAIAKGNHADHGKGCGK